MSNLDSQIDRAGHHLHQRESECSQYPDEEYTNMDNTPSSHGRYGRLSRALLRGTGAESGTPNSMAPTLGSSGSLPQTTTESSLGGASRDAHEALISLRSSRDYFPWLHSLHSLHPRAYPYVNPEVPRPATLSEPGIKPRPTDIRSPEAAQLVSPISTTSTVAEDWDAELAAFRSLSDSEREYYFARVREWETAMREKREVEAAVAHLVRDVLTSLSVRSRYLLLGGLSEGPSSIPLAARRSTNSSLAAGDNERATEPTSSAAKRRTYIENMHVGMQWLARRYRPSEADIGRWLADLRRPSDTNWEDWMDSYLQLSWMGQCLEAEDIRGEKGLMLFLDRVEHLTETWSATWRKKIEKAIHGDSGVGRTHLPDLLDLADDWKTWMEFRNEHKIGLE